MSALSLFGDQHAAVRAEVAHEAQDGIGARGVREPGGHGGQLGAGHAAQDVGDDAQAGRQRQVRRHGAAVALGLRLAVYSRQQCIDGEVV